MPLKRGPPGNECEFFRLFQNRKLAARKSNSPSIQTFDPFSILQMNKVETGLFCQLSANVRQFSLTQVSQQITLVSGVVAAALGQALFNQNLFSLAQSLGCLSSKTGALKIELVLARKLPIKPCRSRRTDLLLKRDIRKGDDARRRARLAAADPAHLFLKILRNLPGTISKTLHNVLPPQGFQSPDVCLDVVFGRTAVELPMQFRRIRAPVLSCDLRNGAIGLFEPSIRRMNFNDSADRNVVHLLARVQGNKVDTAIRGIHHNVVPVIEFVVQPAINDMPCDQTASRIVCIEDGILRGAGIQTRCYQATMHGLDDVASFTGSSKCCFKMRRQSPSTWRDFRCKSSPFQDTKPPGPKRHLNTFVVPVACSLQIDQPLFSRSNQLPIQIGEAVLIYLPLEFLEGFKFRLRTEFQSQELTCPQPHALADIVPGYDKILAFVVAAAQHDVGVGMFRVEMIDRDPIEPCFEVRFHGAHQVTDEGFQIFQFSRIFGRDDEAKLMPVVVTSLQELTAINLIACRTVELAWFLFLRDAVALEITKMCARGGKSFLCPLPRKLDDPRFDNDTPGGRTEPMTGTIPTQRVIAPAYPGACEVRSTKRAGTSGFGCGDPAECLS